MLPQDLYNYPQAYLQKSEETLETALNTAPAYRAWKGLRLGEIEYTFTSGTTGDRVINIWDQNWWDADLARYGLHQSATQR